MKKKHYDSWSQESFGPAKRLACYETHPSLKFSVGGTIEYEIFGGSCSNPIVEDADIYIGFSSFVTNPTKAYPWEPGYIPTVIINYPILDGMAPHDLDSFVKLIEWTCNQLHQGKRVHAGCIGGHGRTGLFLAAIVARMTGMVDAIQYVRQNYCKKSVESASQVDFLVKHFGVSDVEGSKKPIVVKENAGNGYSTYGKYNDGKYNGQYSNVTYADGKPTRRIAPINGPKLIW